MDPWSTSAKRRARRTEFRRCDHGRGVGAMRRSDINYAHVVRRKLDSLSQDHDGLDIFFEVARREFCIALQSMSLDLMDSLDRGLDSLGATLARLESSTRKVISTRDNHARAREIEATFSAEQERAEKTLLSMWLQGFVYRLPEAAAQSAHDHAQQVGLGLDAVDFAFSRYALNIAISSSNVSKEKIISSRVPGIIVSMLDGANTTMVPLLPLSCLLYQSELSGID